MNQHFSLSALGLKISSLLNGLLACFFRSDPNCFFDCVDKNLSITNFAGLCSFHHRDGCVLHHAVAEHNLDLDFGQKVDGVFAPTIDLGMTLLAAKAFDFRYRHTLNSEV